MSDVMTAVWNHDTTRPRGVMVDSDRFLVDAGQFISVPQHVAKRIVAEAKRINVPLSLEAPGTVVVAGKVWTDPIKEFVVPAAIFDAENLLKLDRSVLVRFAECLGLPPLFGAETTKKQIVKEILDFQGATVPPTATGEKQAGATDERNEA